MTDDTSFKWVRETLDSFEDGAQTFSSRHVDEFGVPTLSWKDALASFDLLTEALPGSGNGRLSLALPLRETTYIMQPPPPNLEQLADPWQPASLYWISADHLARVYGDGEEYRARIELVGVSPSKVVELTSYRNTEGVRKGWEFANPIWINHVSP